jgi:hypothetical protein
MKQSTSRTRILLLSFCLILSLTAANAQPTLVRSWNNNGYYQTGSGSVFTWSGSTLNGYCHGYGTIQWYDNGNPSFKYIGGVKNGKNEGYGTYYNANGNRSYAGYWQNDVREGYGTSYNSDGSIYRQGYYTNDAFKYEDNADAVAKKCTNYIINNEFDGGINRRYTILKCIYDTDNKLVEMEIRITFNGDIINTNSYACTLAIKNYTTLSAEVVDCNERAETYRRDMRDLKIAVKVYEILDTLSQN